MNFYSWPGFGVKRFEMSVVPNLRTFVGPYTPTVQALDLLGERWAISMTLAPIARDKRTAAAMEAFWDRLRGQVNGVAIGHQVIKVPQGTLRGSSTAQWKNASSVNANWVNNASAAATWSSGEPFLLNAIGQLANTAVIRCPPGKTLLAGDLIGLGGQLVRQLTDTAADGSGNMAIEFTPRARIAMPAGTGVMWNGPTANFILKPGTTDVPTSWTPGAVIDGATIELIEVF